VSADDIMALAGDFKGRIYVLLGSMVPFPVKKYSSLTGKYCSCVCSSFLQSIRSHQTNPTRRAPVRVMRRDHEVKILHFPSGLRLSFSS